MYGLPLALALLLALVAGCGDPEPALVLCGAATRTGPPPELGPATTTPTPRVRQLHLPRALARTGKRVSERFDLELRLPAGFRSGPIEVVSNGGYHRGPVHARGQARAAGTVVDIELELGRERRHQGGRGRYRLTFDGARASYSGTFTETVSGRVHTVGGPVRVVAGSAGPPPLPRTVILDGPLGAVVATTATATGAGRLVAEFAIAAGDGGLFATPFVRWHDGRWFQGQTSGPLAAGRWRLDSDLTATGLVGLAPGLIADTFARSRATTIGLALAGPGRKPRRVVVERLDLDPHPPHPPAPKAYRLHLVDPDDPRSGAATGQPWRLRFRPEPWPSRPYDPNDFRADLVIERADGSTVRLPAFHHQPHRLIDRGDREVAEAVGGAAFEIRWRPRLPGTHRLTLEATWENQTTRSTTLGDLVVAGDPWDEMVRLHPDDPRFLALVHPLTGSATTWWPIGVNLHSVFDARGRDRIGHRLTPQRGAHAYRERLARFAAAGVDLVEIWMSSWNLGLEWRGDWPGYHGLAGYNEANAARLDAVLDACQALGIRVILVVRNHMQGRNGDNFRHNPWARERGGPLDRPNQLFADPRAAAGDARRRRYLVGRWAAHPAVAAWKLWSEVNLTTSKAEDRRAWHRAAAADWKALDPYHHLVTTHFSSTGDRVDRELVADDGIDLVLFNNYHHDDRSPAEQLWTATNGNRGAGRIGKPVLCTEYGGSWRASSRAVLTMDLRVAGWLGLVCGHAGTPLNWWHEWIDLENRFAPYRAIRGFMATEDPADPIARAARLEARSGSGRTLWAAGWLRPGHLLAYLVDHEWTRGGGPAPEIADAVLRIGNQVGRGRLALEWWDADRGQVLATSIQEHPGGRLEFPVPPFRAHLALKLHRD